MLYQISSEAEYEAEYLKSVENPEKFWDSIAENFKWQKKWDKTLEWDFKEGETKWFQGAKLNISENCLDRHLEENGDKIAIIWEANNPEEESRKITYQELADEVGKFANLLRSRNVGRGDRVCIYMPMIPEAIIAMLACARLGALHSVVFAGFSSKALAERIQDSASTVIVTADRLYRGAKEIDVDEIVEEALKHCSTIDTKIIYRRAHDKLKNFVQGRDLIWQTEINKFDTHCSPEIVAAEHPLFVLYTSGSTGRPKGVQHSTAGYMVYAAYSYANVFQPRKDDIFWCSADIGWITGHSYLVYGPLLNGSTIVMFEGIPTYPNASRFWEVIEKHQVNIFYTAPTAIRSLMKFGNEFVEKYQMSSLKTLGSVGEPINKEAWQWYKEKVGKGKCPIVDTWWQTETGGIMISNLAGVTEEKQTFATKPLPGVQPVLIDNDGNEVTESFKQGNLCFKFPWPSILRSTYGDHDRCIETYFSQVPNMYFSGDGCFKDREGNYRIIGRVDDVINVSGHRFGTAEIENAINIHDKVVESAVVGFPHDVKGEGIYAFVIANDVVTDEEINDAVKDQIGSVAKPDKIVIVKDLPKTRSGKIMRRILRKIAAEELDDFGDISTLVNPDVVEELKRVI